MVPSLVSIGSKEGGSMLLLLPCSCSLPAGCVDSFHGTSSFPRLPIHSEKGAQWVHPFPALLTNCIRSHFLAKREGSVNRLSSCGLIKPSHPLTVRKENMYQQGI